MGKGQDEGNIKTFLRIRPSKYPSGFFTQDEFDDQRLLFNVPVNLREGEYVNNTRTNYNYKFDGILGTSTNQEQVFNKIGYDAVMNVLSGYNSTIFAYGQTGSGKTFTITGGVERYVDRGITPRSLSLLFSEFKKRSDMQYTCHISYLELYNEQGYDLLDPSHDTKGLEDMPRVTLMEDEGGNIHLRNLSMCLAATEEEALNFLFLGDTNRAIAETAMNKASSRSHCMFTIFVEGRQSGGDKVVRSKLHLVDLAGSERVHKTQTSGATLKEAKYINVSLLYLEMVIVALHEKSKQNRTHIPYRNSMMTSVLRDSLGGNCKTVMVATINPEESHTEESISTCRFAQRVSLIKNDAVVNEDVDPSVTIRRLKEENYGLKEEIKYLKGEAGEGDALTEEDYSGLMQRCKEYVEDAAQDAMLRVGAYTMNRIKACFSILKKFVLDARSSAGASGGGGGGPELAGGKEAPANPAQQQQLATLKATLLQRDNEIAILVNMVKQTRGGGPPSEASTDLGQFGSEAGSHTSATTQRGDAPARQDSKQTQEAAAHMRVKLAPPKHDYGIPRPEDRSVLEDPQKAFTYFRSRYPGEAAIEENKTILRDKYAEAKAMGERVNQARSTINYLKTTIEQIRRERAMDGLFDNGGGESKEVEDPEEERYKQNIDKEKQVYKESFQALRDLKAEIEHIQKLLNNSRLKMQSEFDAWYEPLVAEGTDPPKSARRAVPEPQSARNRSQVPSHPGRHAGESAGHPHKPTTAWESPAASPQAKHAAPGAGYADPAAKSGMGKPPTLTGDKEADDDIMAFYKAKEELQRRKMAK